MAITVVQRAAALSNAVAFGSNNTAGNLLTAVIQAADDVTGVTDTAGNTWAKRQDPGGECEIWDCLSCLAGANTVTAANGFGSSFAHIQVTEVNTSTGTWATDGSNGVFYGVPPTDTPDSGNVTTTAADTFLIGGLANVSSLNYTWGAGWTERYDDATGGAGRSMSAADRIETATGTFSANGTTSTSVSGQNAVAAAYAASGGGATAVPVFMNQYRQRRA